MAKQVDAPVSENGELRSWGFDSHVSCLRRPATGDTITRREQDMGIPYCARVNERVFLNLPGFHGGAYVYAYVEDTSERDLVRDDDCDDPMCTHNFEPQLWPSGEARGCNPRHGGSNPLGVSSMSRSRGEPLGERGVLRAETVDLGALDGHGDAVAQGADARCAHPVRGKERPLPDHRPGTELASSLGRLHDEMSFHHHVQAGAGLVALDQHLAGGEVHPVADRLERPQIVLVHDAEYRIGRRWRPWNDA